LLQRSHDELEERVRQRTLELSDTAYALQMELRDREAAEARIKNLFTRLVTAQEDERRRISREIHDQIGQQITALRMHLEKVRHHCQADPEGAEQVERTARLAQALDENIDFLTWDLRPMALDHFGLRAALDALVRGWSERFGIAAGYHDVGMEKVRLPEPVETHMYRIAQEALHNIVRHADATSVAVVLECAGNDVSLMIEDDGCGFDPEGSASERAGMGLLGMRERGSLIGGKVEIESSPGSGTTVYVRVPLSPAT
jgi:chemotaxis family two-component system sensor kinase Cph1